MTLKHQRPARRPKVAGHNRPRPAPVLDEPVAEEPQAEPPDIPEDDDAQDDDVQDDDAQDDDAPETAVPTRSKTPRVLVGVAALLVGAGVFFMVKSRAVETVDAKAMTEVSGQVKAGLEKIFSFSYDKLDAAGAHDVLAGQAVGEYDKLIAQVKQQAPAQKLVLATRVTTTGVKSVDGGRAELLVFLDQVATRADTGKTNGSAAALTVRAERFDGTWKIVELIPR